MWRRHFIGILLSILIFVGWTIFYQPAPQSSRNSLIHNFRGYLGESTWVASADGESSVRRDEKPGWHPATYHGLVIGKSTRADMVRVLGEPLSSGPSADQGESKPIFWNDYGITEGTLSGRLGVEVDNRRDRVVSISISPDKMSKEEAIEYFGNDYQMMGYEFCEGLPADTTSGPVYENPNDSEIDYMEYRSRGIAIHLDYRGNVNAIYFVSEPIGLASKEDCKKELEGFNNSTKQR